MKNSCRLFISFILISVLLSACATEKNRFVNRQYHFITTKYNVLFNGKEAFAIGTSILDQVYDDNFFEILLVEPIAINGENIDNTTIIPGFAKAEEKAVKAIQKHSMNIKGVQRNGKIDEAYLLLGKARYYDRRFFPALEAFNYLLENYADPKTYVEGRIWREKTNLRLKNEELAIKNLRSLALNLNPNGKFHSPANSTIAQAFINTKQLDSALFYIKRAAVTAKSKAKKGRFLFITGQLFESLQKIDSAAWAYSEVVNLKRKSPRKYWINAEIKRLQIRYQRDSISPIPEFLKLDSNYENKPFEHWIKRAMAQYYLKQSQDSLGRYYLVQSNRSEFIDFPTGKANYRDLVDYHFNNGEYPSAGAYLDSLIALYPEGTSDRKRTQRERDNLNGVIKYERIVATTDSLLYLTSLSDSAQTKYFEDFIKQKELKALAAVKEEEKGAFSFLSRSKASNQFYFNNPTLVILGQQKFQSSWGNRPNVDNWRIAAGLSNLRNTQDQTVTASSEEEIFVQTPESYVASLPSTEKEKDSIKSLNDNSYLQLGMIYKENFQNLVLARNRLEHLIDQNPPPEIMAPALYHLYKTYEDTFPVLANIYFDRIVKDYPETAYGKMLSNPEGFKLSEIDSPEGIYESILEDYLSGDFSSFKEKIEASSILLGSTNFAPKLELLMANMEGRLKGIPEWEAALNKIQSKYPETPEAIKAAEMIAQISRPDFINKKNKIYKNYKWIFKYNTKDSLSLNLTKTNLQAELERNPKANWFFSQDRFDEDHIFLVLHGIRDRRDLNVWKENFIPENKEILTANNFVILSSQYQKLLKDKNLTPYEK